MTRGGRRAQIRAAEQGRHEDQVGPKLLPGLIGTVTSIGRQRVLPRTLLL